MHTELVLGHGSIIGHKAVELLMRRAGLKGLTGSKPDGFDGHTLRCRSGRPGVHPIPTESAVGHRHHRTSTREGIVYRAVVRDVYSRRMVG